MHGRWLCSSRLGLEPASEHASDLVETFGAEGVRVGRDEREIFCKSQQVAGGIDAAVGGLEEVMLLGCVRGLDNAGEEIEAVGGEAISDGEFVRTGKVFDFGEEPADEVVGFNDDLRSGEIRIVAGFH